MTDATRGTGAARVTDATLLNRTNWDARAAVHGQDGYYDLDALRAGADTLTPPENAALALAGCPDVAGIDILHVQCHLGFDAVSLARRGARVTGVDFSPVALERARRIAADCGVPVRYVAGDAMDLPAELHGRFDLAYATIGILCWIGDVDAWMRSVAACLRSGGALVLVDIHPLVCAMADEQRAEGLLLDFPYGFDGPHEIEVTGTYADRDAPIRGVTVQYAHSLGEVVTAALAAGLRVTGLVEHLGQRVDGVELPDLFTLTARR